LRRAPQAAEQLRDERAATEAHASALEGQLAAARAAADDVGSAAAQLEDKARPRLPRPPPPGPGGPRPGAACVQRQAAPPLRAVQRATEGLKAPVYSTGLRRLAYGAWPPAAAAASQRRLCMTIGLATLTYPIAQVAALERDKAAAAAAVQELAAQRAAAAGAAEAAAQKAAGLEGQARARGPAGRPLYTALLVLKNKRASWQGGNVALRIGSLSRGCPNTSGGCGLSQTRPPHWRPGRTGAGVG